ncbi:hypothetical protein ACWDUN_00730 [Mycobacterium sp. NPDC003323]
MKFIALAIGIAVFVLLLVGVAVYAYVTTRSAQRREKERIHREEAARLAREKAAAHRRQKEERARLEERNLTEALGKRGAALLKRAKSSVQQVVSTEAAQLGHLGEVDFAPDVKDIEDSLRKLQALQAKSNELSGLPAPSSHDRDIVAHARSSITRLERRASERVKLLEKCASEAALIDDSLRKERDEKQLAAQREELHGELAALLYVTDTAHAVPVESAADSVIARVQAYQEIRGQIVRARADDMHSESKGESEEPSWIPAPLRDAWKWIAE